LVLLVSGFYDIRYRIIPNWLTFSGIAVGIVGHLFMPGWEPLKQSFIGAGFGFVALLPFFWVGGMGGGDVKLMAAIGALQTWPDVFFSLCYGGVIGGIMAMVILLVNGRLIKSFKLIGRTVFTIIHPAYKFVTIKEEETIQFPYGVALVAGTLLRLAEIKLAGFPFLHF
jgi:prepilin peptidase CpaA